MVKQETKPDSVIPPTPAAAPATNATDSGASFKTTLSTNESTFANNNEADLLRPENRPLPELAPKKAILPQTPNLAANEPAPTRESLTQNWTKPNSISTLEEAKQASGNISLADSAKGKPGYRKQLKNDNASIVANTKPVDNQSKNFNYYSNTLDKVYKSKAEYEQIVIAKTARDSNAFGSYTKPREQEMNRSRKELSERQAKKNPDALLSGFISGRVTDQANNPLSNALVRIDDSNKDFYTDQKGYFNIPVKDSVVNVAVGYSGYYTQNIKLLNNSDNKISLNQLGIKAPNPLLNESLQTQDRTLDTVAFKTLSKDLGLVNTPAGRQKTIQNAQPEYGWLEYQQYLEKNKRLPAGTPN
ncbi:carboxypeptidase-like regulatory domain-containing protein [Paraflavitalea speifideaquila]|uniref:carboxypeptidase-like regulatory domain-containing protein n=1 Tax=Paraflavitalea speifideaquila TaxID=3076558 RepID=UPI0028EA00D7|nr:carboxypeptidase-like regulatory domain-containing protein [Paraflavitalea speifideiaquila]